MANRKMSKLERARQFMPFSALKGFYTLVREKELIKEDRKEIIDGEELSKKLNLLKKGMLIRVKYYNKDHYENIEGVVFSCDKDFRILTIVKTKISFDDIIEIGGIR